MKSLSNLIAAMLFSLSSYAQYSISGTITSSESGVAVANANVVVVNSEFATQSNQNGEFILTDLPGGTMKIRVTHVAFKDFEKEMNISGDVILEIILNEVITLDDEVVIRSLRADENTPMTFSEVEKEELESNNFGRDIPFVLEQQPSVVSTSDAGAGIGYTGIRIRGSDQTRINVTINGVPLNDAEGQGVFWVNLPDLTSSTESIQVQRGVGTSTNGPGAFGGSININTLGTRVAPYAELIGTWGSYNTRRYTMNAGTGIINNKFSVDARVSKLDSEGYVDRATSDLISLYTSMSYYGKKSKLSFNILSGREKTYQAWYGVPQSRIENDVPGMMEHIANNGLSAEQAENLLTSGRTYNFYQYENEVDDYGQDHYQLLYTQDIGEKLVFNTTLFYTHGEGFFEQFRENDGYSDYGISNPIIGMDTIMSTDLIRRRWLDNDLFGFNYSFELQASDELQMTLGGNNSSYSGDHFGEIIWAEVAVGTDIRERIYDNVGDKNEFSTFLKGTYSINDKISIFGDLQYRGVNYSAEGIDIDQRSLQVDESFSFFNPKLGLSYNRAAGEVAYISYSVGNREPVRNDFIDAIPGMDPKHETLFNWEAGYRITRDQLTFGGNFYFMDYKNQLVLTGELNDVGSPIRTNVESSYRTGVELDASLMLATRFRINANAAISQNKIKEFDEILYDYGQNWDEFNEVRTSYTDTDISFSPNFIGGGTFSFIPIDGVDMSLIGKFVGQQYLDNTSNEGRIIPSYFVTDLRFSYTFNPRFMRELGIAVFANNILNTLYESNGYTFGYFGGGNEIRENFYYAQAETNFLASLTMKF